MQLSNQINVKIFIQQLETFKAKCILNISVPFDITFHSLPPKTPPYIMIAPSC